MSKIKVCDNVYIDKIYVINLDYQVELRKNIELQLKKYNLLENTKFISAIHMPENPTQGCKLSHHLALKDMLNNNYDAVMILEDDCLFTEFPFIIEDKVPKDWMLLYPGYLVYDELSYYFNKSFLKLVDARSAHCYIVRKPILNYMITMTCIPEIPIDMRYVEIIQRAVPCYGFYPIKAYQSKHNSSITNKYADWIDIFDKKALICYKNKTKSNLDNTWSEHFNNWTKYEYNKE